MRHKNLMARLTAIAASVLVMATPITAAAETYYSGVAAGNTKDVPVTVTYAYEGTRPKALIPDSIQLNGSTGTYQVGAYALTEDIDKLDTPVNIVPASSFQLRKQGGSQTATATVRQDKTSFTADDIKAGRDSSIQYTFNGVTENKDTKEAWTDGTITVTGLSNGTWNGTLTFTVS